MELNRKWDEDRFWQMAQTLSVDALDGCLSVNGRTSERVNVRTQTGMPSRNIGTARTVR